MSHTKTENKNTFDNALVSIAESDIKNSQYNLAELANHNNVTLGHIGTQTTTLLNKLVKDKAIVLQGFNYKELNLTNKVSQFIKRHNTQVIWSMARNHFDTDGQTSAFLKHVTVGNAGASFNGSKNKTVKISDFTTLNCCKELISFSIKKDTDSNSLDCTVTSKSIDFVQLLSDYDDWKNTLVDYSDKLTLDSDATTAPQSLPLVDDTNAPAQQTSDNPTMLKKELQNSRDIVQIKDNDIKTQQSEIDILKERINQLEQENKNLFNQLSPAKRKKLLKVAA